MSFENDTSLYDILDIKPDASPQEVREAYLRTKSAYNKDSVALYTLISPNEREEMLSRIQNAYETLSSEDRRREYDRNHGMIDLDKEENFERTVRAPYHQKIISIDRVPPMESSSQSESMLVAPSTDFTSEKNIDDTKDMQAPQSLPSVHSAHAPAAIAPPTPIAPPVSSAPTNVTPIKSNEAAISQEIAQEVEWKGGFLRRVRESRRISIEEMSSITKVGKNYLLAIEEESFSKLPAAVFLRGFINQIAKTLRLPHNQVVSAYMARYQQSRPDKTGR